MAERILAIAVLPAVCLLTNTEHPAYPGPMPRTSASDLYADAVMALGEALTHHGCDLREAGGGLALDIPEAGEQPVEVVALSYASPGVVRDAVRARRNDVTLRILVADAIPVAAKELLQEAGWGWLDRRGSLFVRTRGLFLNDYTMRSMERVADERPTKAVRGRAGISAAALLLMTPDQPQGVREIARQANMAPSTVSVAIANLREASLLMSDGRPLVPELFWELAEAWKPHRYLLADLPDPNNTIAARELNFGLDPEDAQGWVVGGTVAALAWGAPLVATADYPPDFYVPSPAVLRSATHRLGEVRWERRGCSAAVALSPIVTGLSRLHGRRRGPWPTAHPLFVALDLAQDKARGVEILADWTPPKPFVRVW